MSIGPGAGHGAHGGLRGKGPLCYENNTHVPMVIAHPEVKAGRSCAAVTSHLDLLPTLVSLGNVPEDRRPDAVKKLPGRVLRLNALLNDLMSREVGVNDGRFPPASVRSKKGPLD